MFKSRQIKRKKILIIVLAVLVLLCMAFYFGYKIFTENKISKFNVETSNLNCSSSDEISNYLRKQNLNYFYLKASDIEDDLRKKFFCIGKIESEISYPDKVKLKITGREGKFVVTSVNPDIETNPQIVLSLEQINSTQSSTAESYPPRVLNQILDIYKDASRSAMFLVDEEGMVFEEVNSDTAFPKLSIFSIDLKIGQKIQNDYIKKASEILQKLQEFGVPSDNLIIVSDRLIVDTIPRVIFSLNKPIDRQAASLQLILRQAKMKSVANDGDSRSVESVDLRFNRPVVVYSKK